MQGSEECRTFRLYKIAPGAYEVFADLGDTHWPPASWSLTPLGVLEFFQRKYFEIHGYQTAVWDAKRTAVEKLLGEPALGLKGVIQV
jgi:hypothetical protein